MRQFDPAMQLEHVLERGSLTPGMLAAFGRTLASQHAALPRLKGRLEEIRPRILDPVENNFSEIAGTGLHAGHAQMLATAHERARTSGQTLRPLLEERMLDGTVRECHGDLHLSNLVHTGNSVTAFDCLEFNANLRWIDPISDVAFLFMDCHVRCRPDLAYAFVNAYLDASGDFRGACLLAYYAAYRSTVRAKVAALRWDQQPDTETAQRFMTHLRWGHDWQNRPAGLLVLMCGLSGSGKSQLAGRLLTELPALRLRSDVARKTLAGLPAGARSNSPIDGGLYDPDQSDRVFSFLGEIASSLLMTGENVIVDATFIAGARRREFLDMAARLGVKAVVLVCEAPVAVLRERVARRAADSGDASEATLDILRLQLDRFEVPTGAEPVIRVATGQPLAAAQIATLVEEILQA
jgi:predicted kinase